MECSHAYSRFLAVTCGIHVPDPRASADSAETLYGRENDFYGVTASSPSPQGPLHSWTIPSPPPPDTPEGRALIYALVLGVAYVLLLVADATTLANDSAAFIELPLILGTVASFAIASMLASEYARIRNLDLELARTVSVHRTSDQMPEPESPLGNVMKEYARASMEFRRSARSHAYAAGPIVWGTLVAFWAMVSWGVGLATGTTWLVYFALVVEIPALALLTFGIAVLGTTVGVNRRVDGFDALTPRRWRRFDQQTRTIEETIRICPWLDQFSRDLHASFLGGALGEPEPPRPES